MDKPHTSDENPVQPPVSGTTDRRRHDVHYIVTNASPASSSGILDLHPAILGAAGIGGLAAGLATDYTLASKTLAFDKKVAEATLEDIKKMGLAGGLASTPNIQMDGVGAAGGIVKERHYLNLLTQEENLLPRILHNLGGKGMVSICAGVAGAALAGAAAYGLVGSGKRAETKVEKLMRERDSNDPAVEIAQR